MNVIYILGTILLDFVLGDPPNLPHPIRIIGYLVRKTESFMRKINTISLKTRGFVFTFFIILAVVFVIDLVLYISKLIHPIMYYVFTIYFLYTGLAARCLEIEARKVFKALEENDLDKARKLVSMLVGRDTKMLDSQGVARAVVETVAENTIDGVLAPLFYIGIGLLIGIPVQMLFIYKTVNTLDSMVGYIQEPYKEFGYASAKIDDLLNFIPARLGSVIMLFAGGLLGYNLLCGWDVFKRDRLNHKSPNSAHPEAVVAGLLNIQLGGPSCYFGEKVDKPYIGKSRGEIITHRHIDATIKVMYMSELLMSSIIIFVLILA